MSEETESRDLMEDEMQRQKRLLEVDLMERDETDTDQQPRLSFFFDSNSLKSSTNRENILSKIDRVEQLVTLNLQKINENIVLSNEVITNQLVPKLEMFNKNSNKIYNNITHIKEFYENAANVNILTKKDVDIDEEEEETEGEKPEGSGNGGDTGNEEEHAVSAEGDNDTRFSGAALHGGVSPERVDRDGGGVLARGESNTEMEVSCSSFEFGEGPADGEDRLVVEQSEANEVTKGNTSMQRDGLSMDTGHPQHVRLHSDTIIRGFKLGMDDESTVKTTAIDATEGVSSIRDLPGPLTELKEMSGYESPEWEEPPELQSTKFSNKRRKTQRRNRTRDAAVFGSDETTTKSLGLTDRFSTLKDIDMDTSEPTAANPFQSPKNGKEEKVVVEEEEDDDVLTSSSFEEAPELLSEHLGRRP